MEIKLYFSMLKRGWWIIALTILVAINVALIFSYLTKPIYRTVARFSVSPSPVMISPGQETLNSLEALDSRSIVQTYAEFLNSQQIYSEALRFMDLNPANMNEYTHTTVVIPSANILELTVEGPDPEIVAMLANNIGQSAIARIKQLYNIYDINVLDPALIPTVPIKPLPLRDASVSALLGLILGAALAISSGQIRESIDSYRNRGSLDPVSMVLNSRYLQIRIDELITKNPTKEMSLGFVRLNGLRDLIDALPLGVTQTLFRQVSAILQNELRGNDMIGRWNDATFAIVLPATPETAANRTMDRIRTALLKPIHLENYDETILLDPNIGVSAYQEGDTTSDVIARADDALERGHITTNDGLALEG